MEGAVIVIWVVIGGVIVLSLLLPWRDSFRRKKRGALIKQIAESLNWEFFPRHRLPRFDSPVNVLQGKIGQAKAYIFDTPIQTFIEPYDNSPARGSVVTILPGTKMLLKYEQAKLPQILLRPSEIGDRFFPHIINAKNFVVRSDDLDTLMGVFTPEVIAHYEKMPNLYIAVQSSRILLYFQEGEYLEPEKERYLDLIAEGKYINQLVEPFLP